jgi:hypothetical protein
MIGVSLIPSHALAELLGGDLDRRRGLGRGLGRRREGLAGPIEAVEERFRGVVGTIGTALGVAGAGLEFGGAWRAAVIALVGFAIEAEGEFGWRWPGR